MITAGDRLWERLGALYAVGADPRGGTSRHAFSPEHANAVRMVADWMRKAGLTTGVEPTGNLIGVLPGRDPGLPAIGLGSHLDTVPCGGKFDGALGVLAALEVAQTLSERGERLNHPLAVIGFADEEGNNFGVGCLSSQLFTGAIPPERLERIADRGGRTLAEAIARFAGAGLPPVKRPALAAYLELHVEQGPLLDSEGRPAAAVEAIVGISRTTVSFTGEANHGGTTPMHLRRDALWGAAELATFMRELGMGTAGRAVTTVGVFEVRPGATNVIPGEAELRIEMRSPDEVFIAGLRRCVEERARAIGAQYGLQVALDNWHHAPAVPMHPRAIAAVQGALVDAGQPVYTMPSWAGHDAKILARSVPSGMIFVPSMGGRSHSPLEETAPESCALGAELLYHAALRLDDALAEMGRSGSL